MVTLASVNLLSCKAPITDAAAASANMTLSEMKDYVATDGGGFYVAISNFYTKRPKHSLHQSSCNHLSAKHKLRSPAAKKVGGTF